MNNSSRNVFNGNFEKYEDPEYYDLEYQNYLSDVPFLAGWAEKSTGPIIDLGCGTGRVTIHLSQQGHQLIGVDLHEGMLGRAREKTLDANLSIDWVLQDCTQLALNIEAPLIYMTGNSFQHFLTNESQNQLLKCVKTHLSNDGVFIFNTRFPVLSELAQVEESTRTYTDKRHRKIREKNTETYHPLTQILNCTSVREILEGSNENSIEQDSISLRYVFPLEMERLLTDNGFEILEVYSSWDKKPLHASSSEMIYVCQKR